MQYLISIVIQFVLGERFRQIVTDFLAKTLKKSLKTKRSRQKKKRGKNRKRKHKKMEATIQEIQEELKSRIPNPQNALIEKEGVKYFLSLDEDGLRNVPGELSYCGLEQETFSDEYLKYNPSAPVESVRDIPTLGVEGAADLIEDFMEWYFTKPPKRNFYALPPLLWNVVCNSSFLAPHPTIARVQRLIGDPKPDGIWGSGTTARVTEFFENATVPTIFQFAKDFTDLIKDRYVDLGERSPEFAETCDAWCERADRQVALLEEFIENQSSEVNEEESRTPQLATQEEIEEDEQQQREVPGQHHLVDGASFDQLVAALEKNNELTQELIDLQRQSLESTPTSTPAAAEEDQEDQDNPEGQGALQAGANSAKKVLGAAESLTKAATNPAGTAKKLLDELL